MHDSTHDMLSSVGQNLVNWRIIWEILSAIPYLVISESHTCTNKKYSEKCLKSMPRVLAHFCQDMESPTQKCLDGFCTLNAWQNFSLNDFVSFLFCSRSHSRNGAFLDWDLYLFITPSDNVNPIRICLPTMSDILSDNCFLCIITILLWNNSVPGGTVKHECLLGPLPLKCQHKSVVLRV